MDSQDNIKFTHKPCPECKKDGTPTGFLVKTNCEHCLGTGRKRDTNTPSFTEMLRQDFQ